MTAPRTYPTDRASRIARAVMVAVAVMLALYVPLRVFRYAPMVAGGQALVLDRWRHEVCAVGATPHCVPLR